jgi:hypothetical protein
LAWVCVNVRGRWVDVETEWWGLWTLSSFTSHNKYCRKLFVQKFLWNLTYHYSCMFCHCRFLNCPQCRKKAQIPPQGVEGFQTNFYLREDDLESARQSFSYRPSNDCSLDDLTELSPPSSSNCPQHQDK